MDQTKLNEIGMLPLLERVLGFKAMILFLVNFFSNFDLHFFINFYLFKGFFMENMAHIGQNSRKRSNCLMFL
jgi:hypothetical protein